LVMRALLKGIKLLFTDCGASYYRHHGASVISVSSNVNSINALRSRMRVLEKITKGLDDKEILSNYKIVIGQAYHKLARNSFFVDRELARVCLERSKIYAGKDSIVGGRMHKFLCKIFGLEFKENLAYFLSKTNVYSNVYRNKYNTLKNLSKKTGTQCG